MSKFQINKGMVEQSQPDNKATQICTMTSNYWEARCGVRPTLETSRIMVANVSGFFSVLNEWEQILNPEPCADLVLDENSS
jgi:hypothetical protein